MIKTIGRYKKHQLIRFFDFIMPFGINRCIHALHISTTILVTLLLFGHAVNAVCEYAYGIAVTADLKSKHVVAIKNRFLRWWYKLHTCTTAIIDAKTFNRMSVWVLSSLPLSSVIIVMRVSSRYYLAMHCNHLVEIIMYVCTNMLYDVYKLNVDA